MRRRVFLGTAVLAHDLPSRAAPATTPVIALLAAGVNRAKLDPLFSKLRDLGYAESSIQAHYDGVTLDQVRQVARDAVKASPDVIVAFSNPDVIGAMEATSSIPIVTVIATGPVESGFVKSLSRPGGNITGTTLQASEFGGKLLDLLKQASPRAARVGLVWDPRYPGMNAYYREALKGAAALGVVLEEYRANTEREIEECSDAIRARRPDSLCIGMTGALYRLAPRLIALAAELRLPAIYSDLMAMRAGGLMAYSADYAALMSRSATYVDKILRGAKPADLPVEEPISFSLGLNLKTAEALGLTMPRSLLLQATTTVQ